MTVRKTFDPNEPITEEEIEMLKKAEKMSPVFDEDSPELTAEQLRGFRRISDVRREEQRKFG